MTTRTIPCGLSVAAALAALVVIGGTVPHEPAWAQQVAPPSYDKDMTDRDARADTAAREHRMQKKSCKASQLIGMEVRTAAGDEAVGSINDLMIHKDGRVAYAAVSFGGFLGLGDKLFAVPFDAIEFVTIGEGDDADAFARIDVREQTLRDRKGFDQDHWPADADRSFLTGSERQVGVRAGDDRNR